MTSTKITLTKDQEKATDAFMTFLVNDDSYLVLEGSAGTGKSFLIEHLLDTFHSKYKAYCLFLDQEPTAFDMHVTATTNKAVAVIDDFLGHLPNVNIQTIFSLLGLRVKNDRTTGKTTLEFNPKNQFIPKAGNIPLVMVDEASYISEELADIIQDTLITKHKAKVVFIGDPFQLAPIGQRVSVLDTIQCNKVRMTEVKRNGGQILKVGTDFRRAVETGKFSPIDYDGVNVIHTFGPEFQKRVEDSFLDPKWHANTSKILCWKNARVHQYNNHIRQALKYPELFEVGETVITNEFIKGTSGDYARSVDSDVVITRMNTDPEEMYGIDGVLVELDNAHVGFMPLNYSRVRTLLKNLAAQEDWKKYFEIKETWLDLRPAYASSVHKAQGSTYETVFIDLTDIGKNWDANDVARLMYVAITRASKQVVCYGFLPDRYS